MTTWLDTLIGSERKVYSQCGEEGVILAILAAIGPGDRFLVDVGAGDGATLSNTKLLIDAGWHGPRFDGAYGGDVHQEYITAENIVDLLVKHEVPHEPDFLSLDIDGVDWYVLRAILRAYRPRMFVCEINNSLPIYPAVAVAYDPGFRFSQCDYFGASLGAYHDLATHHGYQLVHCMPWNAFFVRRDLLPAGGEPRLAWGPCPGWPVDPLRRPWVPITAGDLP